MRTMNKVSIACAAIALATQSCSTSEGSSAVGVSDSATTVAAPVDTKVAGTTAAEPAGLAEGTYQTASLTVDQLAAGAVAAGYTQPEIDAFFSGDWVTNSVIFAIRLSAGGYILTCAADGGPEKGCDHGGYKVIDDHTMSFSTDCTMTFDYILHGDQLSLSIVGDTCPAGDLAFHTMLYELAPYDKIDGESSGTAGGPSGSTWYVSRTFKVPFTVTLPDWLEAAADADEPNLVTWEDAQSGLKVRVLRPVDIYAPGSTSTTPPPEDYLAYLRAQSDHGAHFTDVVETTIGGNPVTFLTATTDTSLDGSLGCQREAMAAADCWGLQPDLILRIAVITAGDTTVLVWLRGNAFATDEFTAHLESFEQMVASVRF